MNEVKVRVPATTANMGPGFDCLGLALKLANVVTVRRGTGMADRMGDEAGRAFFRAAKRKAYSFAWTICGDVPRSRGLGSSVTVRLGILHGLNAQCGAPLGAQRLFEICAELEGHPDNAAPAAFGGFTIARAGAPLQRYSVSPRLAFALLIPPFEVETPAARRVLPPSLAFADAVASAASAAAVAAAFASRRYEALEDAFDDRLHEPFRAPLVPGLRKIIAAGRKAGALGGWLSGSGSTIACATLADPRAVAAAMRRASGWREAVTQIVRADNTGVRI